MMISPWCFSCEAMPFYIMCKAKDDKLPLIFCVQLQTMTFHCVLFVRQRPLILHVCPLLSVFCVFTAITVESRGKI